MPAKTPLGTPSAHPFGRSSAAYCIPPGPMAYTRVWPKTTHAMESERMPSRHPIVSSGRSEHNDLQLRRREKQCSSARERDSSVRIAVWVVDM
eukprot:scaffold215119_cov32-Tisochrysis_lutea.AAC.2